MNKNLFWGLVAIGTMATAHFATAQTGDPCGTDLLNQRYGQQHPERMAYREQMRNQIRSSAMQPLVERNAMVIPTVVHVMHRGGTENISDAQVYDAIRVLNADMRRQNADTANTRALFKPYGADFNVEFRLAQLDPQGNCTNGITHNFSPITYSANDAIKETGDGGTDPWPVNRYFNIWVVGRIVLDQSGVIGYAYFPSWGMSNNYGVVIDNRYFGTIGTAQGKDGRTLTHEVGHCLELYHTFQSGCGSDCSFSGDDVCDTPPVTAASYSCNFSLNTCDNDNSGPSVYGTDGPDMVENYMSYNQGFCQNIFTLGQKSRSDAVFQNTFVGQLITPQNRLSTGTSDGFISGPCALVPDFHWSKSVICLGDSITFSDFTANGSPDAWQWNISGPQNLSSNLPSPTITFTQPGMYSVTLTVTNGQGSPSITRSNLVQVSDGPPAQWAFFDGFDGQPLSTRWTANNLDYGFGWEEKTLSNGNFTMYLNNTENDYDGLKYELYSPAYDLTGLVDPKVSFRTAYAQKNSSSSDRLRMYISPDCGITWILRYTRMGEALASLPISSVPINPVNAGQWAFWQSLVPPAYVTSTHLMLKFVFETGGGNSLYLDDINLMGNASINEQAATEAQMTIMPNPATDYFTIDVSTLNDPTLQLEIYDMSGRRVMGRTIAGGTLTGVYTQGLAAGMYRVTVTGKTGTLAGKLIVTN